MLRAVGRVACVALLGLGCAKSAEIDDAPHINGPSKDAGSHADASGDAAADAHPDTSADVAPVDAADAADDDASDEGDAAEDGGATDAPDDVANPCANVTCDAPPANACKDASTLNVYSPNGTCSGGQCHYVVTPTTCANGCANGACNGDPCLGVTCNAPPASDCADATHLAVYDAPGSCSGGTCSYATHQVYCAFGCAAGVCNGDPCLGVTCSAPPASYCSGANDLVVSDTPGTCSAGTCSYTSHTQYCAFGCSGGACSGDPCAGVACNTPPASYCSTASTLLSFSAPGTCGGGACTYPQTSKACPGGCTNGVCKDCATSADCPAGSYCNGGSCASCTIDQHCGASCDDCTAKGGVCSGGATCVQCTVDSQCGAGKYCNGGACATCDTAQKCGPSCVTCSGTTPSCVGTVCVCTAGSCGANQTCNGGLCAVCKSDSACGASCAACGGSTPKCLDQGATSTCVECLSSADCTSGQTCSNHACVDPCALAGLSASFDGGAAGFTHAPTSGITGDDPWALGTPAGITCHSGTSCWVTNLKTSGYSNCQTAELKTPTVDLSACASSPLTVTLTFWHYYQFEAQSSGKWWDGGALQLSADDGATWNDVTPAPGYQGTISGSYGGCSPKPTIGGHAGWSGTIPGGVWVQESLDLPAAYRVAKLRVRWLFGADEATTSRGWAVDDVAITAH